MKKFLSLCLVAILIFSINPIHASAAIKINKTNATIYIGGTVKLEVKGTTKYVMWKSSDKNVAKVSSSGVVKGVKEGSVTITATVGSGSNNQKLNCKVIVKPRLSTKSKNITCYLDEYIEIKINFNKPKNDEYLVFVSRKDGIVSAEWDQESDDYILRIIPEDVGMTSISVYPATGEGLLDFEMNRDDELKINITVLRDSKWISDSDLDSFGVSCIQFDNVINFIRHDEAENEELYVNSYSITDIDSDMKENQIYTGNGIKYKMIDGEYYFNIDDLKANRII